MIYVKPHYALVDKDGVIYGQTVYQCLKEANRALAWCRKYLIIKLSIVELKAKD